jgi:hypothetical protein
VLFGYVLFGAADGLAFDALAGADAPCLVMCRRLRRSWPSG